MPCSEGDSRIITGQSEKLDIREFSPEYGEEVLSLILRIQREEFGLDISAEDQPDLSDIYSYYQDGGGNFWVASAGAAVVGTVSLLNIGNAHFALRKMFVKQDWRGSEKGVAKALLVTAEQWAKARQTKGIYLGTTEKFLAAHRFYKKNGYFQVPKTGLPAEFPVMFVDKLFFYKAL